MTVTAPPGHPVVAPLSHPSTAVTPSPSDLLMYESHRRVSLGGATVASANDGNNSLTASTPHLPAIQGAARRGSSSNSGANANDVDQMARFATLNRSDSKRLDTPLTTDQSALEERRRASIKKMEAMSHTKSFKDAIGQALKGFTSGVNAEADAEQKLQQVLIAAKESGLSMEKIFSFFSPSEETADIAEEDFAQGLQKLNSDTFHLTPADVKLLVTKFDLNGDAKISMEEFVNFTLNIPHMTWRAEKSRRRSSSGAVGTETEKKGRGSVDQAADVSVSGTSTARRASKSLSSDAGSLRRPSASSSSSSSAIERRGSRGGGSALDLRGSIDRRPSIKPPVAPPQAAVVVPATPVGCPLVATSKLLESIAPVSEAHRPPSAASLLPDMVFWGETAKLLWRVRENLVIRLYYHDPMPSTIAMVTHNEGSGEDYPIIYASRDKIPVDDKAIDQAVADKAAKLRPNTTIADLTPEELANIQSQSRKDYLMAYLVQRLHVEEVASNDGTVTKTTVIKKQTGDEWDSLLCDKPAMVKAPPLIGGVVKASLAEFRRKSLDLERMANEAKLHSTEATRLSEGATSTLTAEEAVEIKASIASKGKV